MVLTMFHHMYSMAGWSVQSVLHEMVHVWQPRHLLRSKTNASCRSTCSAAMMGLAFRYASICSSCQSGEKALMPARSWLPPCQTAKPTFETVPGDSATEPSGLPAPLEDRAHHTS